MGRYGEVWGDMGRYGLACEELEDAREQGGGRWIPPLGVGVRRARRAVLAPVRELRAHVLLHLAPG